MAFKSCGVVKLKAPFQCDSYQLFLESKQNGAVVCIAQLSRADSSCALTFLGHSFESTKTGHAAPERSCLHELRLDLKGGLQEPKCYDMVSTNALKTLIDASKHKVQPRFRIHHALCDEQVS